jgi:hypothetical protein
MGVVNKCQQTKGVILGKIKALYLPLAKISFGIFKDWFGLVVFFGISINFQGH